MIPVGFGPAGGRGPLRSPHARGNRRPRRTASPGCSGRPRSARISSSPTGPGSCASRCARGLRSAARPRWRPPSWPRPRSTAATTVRRRSCCARSSQGPARLEADRIVDGFGQQTLLECIPFASGFDLERLDAPDPGRRLPRRGRGVHRARRLRAPGAASRYCIAELGAGWGPWVGLGGVLARNQGLAEIELIAVEALPARFELLRKHLAANRAAAARAATRRCRTGSPAG